MKFKRTFALFLPLLLAAAAGAHANVHQMFVTSESNTGKMSDWAAAEGIDGIAGADHACQKLAHDAGLDNYANFVAWLSTSTTDAFCHVAGFSGKAANKCGQANLPNAGPWQRVDGRPFSHKLQNLTSLDITLYPARVDETQAVVPGSDVQTGTAADGTLYSPGDWTCSNWTSNSASASKSVGDTNFGASDWTSFFFRDCATPARMYCFEKGVGDTLPPIGTVGALVFATSEHGTGDLSSWPHAAGNSGIAAGDAICRGLATEAGYASPGSFVAYLSAGDTAAIDRLTIDGPWRRPGGVQVAATKADLLAATLYDNALVADIQVDDKANHTSNPTGDAFTGTAGANGQPTGDDCSGWTSASHSDSGSRGSRFAANGSWVESTPSVSCDSVVSLYCFSNVVSFVEDGFESGDTSGWDATTP